MKYVKTGDRDCKHEENSGSELDRNIKGKTSKKIKKFISIEAGKFFNKPNEILENSPEKISFN